MNYQHIYHAGNSADVFKHCVLLFILEALAQKENPFCYVESHAGSGSYDLLTNAAQTTKEYASGVKLLWDEKNLPSLLRHYIQTINTINPSQKLHRYPGSPLFAQSLLRKNDRMLLAELNATPYRLLKKLFSDSSQVHCYEQDGYDFLNAVLPPKEKRGLVFIDPPYENPHEFFNLPDELTRIYKKWPTGIITAWYPIKKNLPLKNFYHRLEKSPMQKILICEFCPWSQDIAQLLNGSGLVIINPPWKLESILNDFLPRLLKYLQQDKFAQTRTFWLQGE